jgi:putative colanic acid biosynthesis acetyltransferase WcaF
MSDPGAEAAAGYQQLSRFRVPAGFRGRPGWFVLLWWLVDSTLFRCSPQPFYGWRRWLLRRFGARVGRGVLVRPSASVTYPWKVTLGAHCWVGDEVVLYSLGPIEIGHDAVVSQRSYLCTGSHDYADPAFAIFARPIVVAPEAWLATDVFVAPGVTIGQGAVVGARSSVFKDVPPGMVGSGNPFRVLRPRRPGAAP